MNIENTWVFLSHSNKDFSKLTIVRNKLEELGYRPLLFFLKCLEDDKEIRELIYREIDARERFILCQSKNSDKSDWVKDEVKYIESLGRPYEVIKLDSDASIDAGIKNFNQRSTIIVWSTEKNVTRDVAKKLEDKAFKVISLKKETGSVGASSSIPNVKSYVIKDHNILNNIYFLVLVSRKLSKEESNFLNWMVKEYRLNAFAYDIENHVDDKNFFVGLDECFIQKETIKKGETGIAKTIVDKLMDWDMSRYNRPSGPSDGNPTQKQQVIEALRRLGGYAKLKDLYDAVDTSSWATKTPQATIRRILQNSEETFMIKPGVWGLKEFSDQTDKQSGGDNKITQKQQVIDALRRLGGYAKLKDLYDAVDTSSWATKTPQATIRRILQNSEETFMIKPGVWGLKE